MKVFTKALIVKSEEDAVKSGAFSYIELMKNAGTAAAKIIARKYGCKNKKITVLCGKGNNGGDGFVIAKWLSDNGAIVKVITPFGEPVSEISKYHFSKVKHLKTESEINECDIIIDALFGNGLNRKMDSNAEEIIKKANNLNAVKVAIDIPSGVECDTGKIFTSAFNTDLTITFIALKPCFLLPPCSDICGEVVVADIGVSPADFSFETNEKPIFQKRKHNSHKGTFGTATLLCGSFGMAGAAILSAKAALRSGVGIVRNVICESIYSPFTAAVPEAVCIPVKDSNFGSLPNDIDIEKTTENASAVLFGCGVCQCQDTEIILENLIKKLKIPLVIDADGINLLSRRIELLKESKVPIILTPHPKEMSRLCNLTVAEIEADRLGIASSFAKEYNCFVLLKGANTVIAEPDGKITVNTNGNTGMATAGSGDVLAGITASLLAQGYSPEFTAKAAVYLHSAAGDKAAKRRSEHALIASDIIEEL